MEYTDIKYQNINFVGFVNFGESSISSTVAT